MYKQGEEAICNKFFGKRKTSKFSFILKYLVILERRSDRSPSFMVLWLEGLVSFEALGQALNSTSSCKKRNDKACPSQYLQPGPLGRKLSDFVLGYVHLDWEVNRQGPKRRRSKQAQEDVEERKDHGYDGRNDDVEGAPHQSEAVKAADHATQRNTNGVFGSYKLDVGPAFGTPCLNNIEDGLAEDLVGTDEVDGDADVGEVDEPERVEEAESGEEVSRGGVAESGVAEAPTKDVEEGGDGDADATCSFHCFVLRWT